MKYTKNEHFSNIEWYHLEYVISQRNQISKERKRSGAYLAGKEK